MQVSYKQLSRREVELNKWANPWANPGQTLGNPPQILGKPPQEEQVVDKNVIRNTALPHSWESDQVIPFIKLKPLTSVTSAKLISEIDSILEFYMTCVM